MTAPFLICAVVTASSALISLGFSIAAVLQARNDVRISNYYTAARSAAFAFIGILPFFNPFSSWLDAVAVGMIIVQTLDTFIGLITKDPMKTFGPAGTAIANLAALIWVMAQ